MTALFRLQTNQMTVDTAAHILKRLYWAERELFRAAASRHAYIANWQAKKALPGHFWTDTLHADTLRSRVLELRYPRRDVDQEPPEALTGVLHELVKARSDAEILSAIYTVFKPALITAYEQYLRRTDALDDAPTVYHLRRLVEEKRAQVEQGLRLLDGLPDREDTSDWAQHLRDCLAAAGGMLGDGLVTAPPGRPGFSDRPGYQRPQCLARDPKFLPALVESPWWEIKTPVEQQVYAAIEHVNEIWATEVPLLVAWELAEMPWEFYRDLSRWAWDECRHSIMGERRLEAWGFEIGVDVPMIDDAYQCVAAEPPHVLLALLNAFERVAPPGRKSLKAKFEQLGDPESAQDVDYDWADEAIHMTIGNRWLAYLVKDEDELAALRKYTLDRWDAYLVWAKTQPLGDYEPFETRIRARMRATEEVA